MHSKDDKITVHPILCMFDIFPMLYFTYVVTLNCKFCKVCNVM